MDFRRHLLLLVLCRHGQPHLVGHLSLGEMLAGLQRPQVADDGPAIAHRDLGAVRGHRAVAFGDHGEEVAHRGLSQPLDVVRRRGGVAPLDDLALSRSQGIVADDAVDHEAILPVAQNLVSHGNGKGVDEVVVAGRFRLLGLWRARLGLNDRRHGHALRPPLLVGLPAREIGDIGSQVPAGHGAFDGGAYRSAIGKEIGRHQRLIARLVGHLLLAARYRQGDKQGDGARSTAFRRNAAGCPAVARKPG